VGSEIYFTVSWGSSRAIRKAWARKALMQRQLSEQDADKIVAEAFDEFQIVVQSLDMTAFSERDEAYFKDKTSLQGRLSAEKVAPSGVRYKRDPKGAVQAVLFSFPKRTPSGEPVIGAREESVGLAIAFEEQTLRVSFDPRRMLDQDGKPDY
jgi:hypothetical protein